MKVKDLRDRLFARLKEPLPGAAAHDLLRATPVGNVFPTFDHKISPKPGGVLILLYEKNNQIKFPLTKRPIYIGAHSGQVSLPGGKSEPGEDLITTALREGEEEIGIDRNKVEVIGSLSDFFVVPSNFLVRPVIAVSYEVPDLRPDVKEVAKIIEGSIDDLLLENAIQHREILAAGEFRMNAPHFEIESEIVWGATAMILNEFRTILMEI